MKLNVIKGQTSKLVQIFIQDSTSTTGAGLTGLVFNSAGLTAYYYREGAASAVAIALATMTLGTWATAGFVVVDGTNLPGVYQLGIPDAALASGANSVVIMLKGATNMAPVILEIQLVSYDPNNATTLGLTNLDAAISSRSTYAGGAVASVTGNVGGNVAGSVGSVLAGVTLAAAAIQAVWDALTANLTTVGSIGKRIVDNLDAVVSTRATPAQVNAEVVDALAVDTYAEPGAVPAATATLAAKLGWLFTLARNKRTTTAVTDTLRNDADSGTIATSTISDDGTTFTRNEYV